MPKIIMIHIDSLASQEVCYETSYDISRQFCKPLHDLQERGHKIVVFGDEKRIRDHRLQIVWSKGIASGGELGSAANNQAADPYKFTIDYLVEPLEEKSAQSKEAIWHDARQKTLKHFNVGPSDCYYLNTQQYRGRYPDNTRRVRIDQAAQDGGFHVILGLYDIPITFWRYDRNVYMYILPLVVTLLFTTAPPLIAYFLSGVPLSLWVVALLGLTAGLLLGMAVRLIGLAVIIKPRDEARKNRKTIEEHFGNIGPLITQENAKTLAQKYELALSTFYHILDSCSGQLEVKFLPKNFDFDRDFDDSNRYFVYRGVMDERRDFLEILKDVFSENPPAFEMYHILRGFIKNSPDQLLDKLLKLDKQPQKTLMI